MRRTTLKNLSRSVRFLHIWLAITWQLFEWNDKFCATLIRLLSFRFDSEATHWKTGYSESVSSASVFDFPALRSAVLETLLWQQTFQNIEIANTQFSLNSCAFGLVTTTPVCVRVVGGWVTAWVGGRCRLRNTPDFDVPEKHRPVECWMSRTESPPSTRYVLVCKKEHNLHQMLPQK